MQITRRKIVTEARDIFLFILLGIAMTYMLCTTCRNDFRNFVFITAFSSSLWIFLWKGNELIAHFISSKISWVAFPVKRMIVGIITTVGYTILAVIGLITFFKLVLHVNIGNSQWTIYSSVLITIIIALILHSRAFLQHWRLAKIDAERFQKESISAKYESLKSQVNPHFLFNSLNALTNLVYEDQDKAVEFIKQLSEVYRYVLDTRDREVVPLEEELKFLKSYLFLQQIRFGDKLDIQLNLNGATTDVPPLCLQMLVENAIKHNIVSEQMPLRIQIYHDSDYLVVENDLQFKDTSSDTPGLGLENITKRYEFLTSRKVQVLRADGKFVVKLPVIEVTIG
ncbi:MAG TPA: histidine kinase [Cyclobacteriaceae bacterium]